MIKPLTAVITVACACCLSTAVAFWSSCVHAAEAAGVATDTMLMFVGEDLEVLSIASRREEGAWQAPAIAQVLTRQQLRDRGIQTLGQGLNMVPGFSMVEKEWGNLPYLRGVSNSILFLYDTVPLGSDISKSMNPTGQELSLEAVKRIEIVRGPGSVLWGPDAFAGIVNIVPMSGKDLDGVDTGVLTGLPDHQLGGYANYGHDAGTWDLFLSASARTEQGDGAGNVERLWGDGVQPVPPDQRYGTALPDSATYTEVSGRYAFQDRISFSGRVSTYERPYILNGPEGHYSWLEDRRGLTALVKLEARQKLDPFSAVRLTASHSFLRPEMKVIDFSYEQQEATTFLEALYDRSFSAGDGLLTAGTSYRRKRIEDAPIWDSFLPDLIGPDNISFLPIVGFEDYDTHLWSIFAQYSHNLGPVSLWVGVRYDDHDMYQDHVSYNTGAAWSPQPAWLIKGIFGTAYRTPFARQLLEGDKPELEEIRSYNIQTSWRPTSSFSASACLFLNQIDNHIAEDFTGLSEANQQDIYGMELDFRYAPFENMNLFCNFTWMQNDGPDETYLYNDFNFIRPDGSIERHFIELTSPFETGPKRLFNVGVTARPFHDVTAFLRVGYHADSFVTYPGATSFERVSGGWLMDAALTFKNVLFPGADLSVSATNLSNTRYTVPGTYDAISGTSPRAEMTLRFAW